MNTIPHSKTLVPKVGLTLLYLALVSTSPFANAGNDNEIADLANNSYAPALAKKARSGAGGYWTAERFRDAQPLSQPEIDMTADDITVMLEEKALEALERNLDRIFESEEALIFESKEEFILEARKGTVSNDDLGDPDSFVLEPDDVWLKERVDNDDTTANQRDFGTTDQYFSSTFLNPRSAAVAYPYSTVGQLYFTTPDGIPSVCSATVVDARLLLTAAHCVHNGNGDVSGYHSNITFIPAYGAYGDGSAPYGVWTAVSWLPTAHWYYGGGALPNAADYAVVQIQDRWDGVRIGDLVGNMGVQTNRLHPNHVTILGYPCNRANCQEMYQINSESMGLDAAGGALYPADGLGGNSGGPFVMNFGRGTLTGNEAQRNYVVGVASYAFNTDADNILNPKQLGSSNLDPEIAGSLFNFYCTSDPRNCH